MDSENLIEFKNIKQIIEALLFSADEPVTINRIIKIVDSIKPKDITQAIDELNTDYENSERAFRIRTIGGGYQLLTKPEFSRYIKGLYKGKTKPRLSQAALEVLSIVAFKQPISRPEIDHIRGVNSDGVVKTLLERNLITITGRSETAGKALLYGTTNEFLVYFGVNSIDDLPKPKEIEELLGSPQEEFKFSADQENTEILEQIADLDEQIQNDDQIE